MFSVSPQFRCSAKAPVQLAWSLNLGIHEKSKPFHLTQRVGFFPTNGVNSRSRVKSKMAALRAFCGSIEGLSVTLMDFMHVTSHPSTHDHPATASAQS
ncbi:hypothetical protein AVEN_38423-1 [Araneus ventricosus]|uniref:Uncharacterized protein n=1 Tax=Araneus ventricosus TaxID=182803 RepID=A0A4Y2R1P6_ARAVE|nr:hypothetical protein AVEN_38423-1 [Araneus ventricosus]